MLQRVVLVTRPTRYEHLLVTHGTHGQARWFLAQRAQEIEPLVAADSRQRAAVQRVLEQVPTSWRVARIQRTDLDRFLFEPEDVVVVVGQDGLVANVARFLAHQVVVGINPWPQEFEGVLVRHAPARAGRCLQAATCAEPPVEARTMVQARTDDGQILRALNEIFVGHESHQSAHYRLDVGGEEERQSSSGLIVATGTGATGWARSVSRERARTPRLPGPEEPSLAWFVREAWPSATTGAHLTAGRLNPGQTLSLVSEQEEGGVVFGDGIETDRLRLRWGQRLLIGRSEVRLRLLSAA